MIIESLVDCWYCLLSHFDCSSIKWYGGIWADSCVCVCVCVCVYAAPPSLPSRARSCWKQFSAYYMPSCEVRINGTTQQLTRNAGMGRAISGIQLPLSQLSGLMFTYVSSAAPIVNELPMYTDCNWSCPSEMPLALFTMGLASCFCLLLGLHYSWLCGYSWEFNVGLWSSSPSVG